MPQRKIGAVVAAGLAGLTLGLPAQAQKSKPKPTPGTLWASRFGGTIRVLYGAMPLPVANPSRMPYRDSRDNAICVAPESLAPLGIVATVEGSSVKLSCADRNLVMVAARQGPFERSGGVFVDVVEVLKSMGIASLSYDAESTTLTVRSILLAVGLQGDSLRVSAGLPISPKVTLEREGLRAVVDISGATLGELPRQLAQTSPKILGVRTQQLDENTARLIVDLAEPLALGWSEGKPTLNAVIAAPGTPTLSEGSLPPVQVAPKPTPTVGKPSLPAPMVLRGVAATAVGDDRLRFALEVNRLPAVRPTLQNETLTLDLGNIYLSESAKSAAVALAEVKHPLIKSAQLVPIGASAARLVVELASQVGFTIKHSKGGGLLLDLLTPRKTDGPLAGKTIVVDPGHGGSSSPGNRGDDGVFERSLTLPIGLMVAQNLEAMGANVVVTRDSDFDPGLEERAIIANRVNADIFVSVHLNDGRPNRTVRGIEVYFHRQEETSRDLARFIGAKVKEKVGTALPLRGARSDSVNAPEKGYAILRNSQMTGVLVELGYMSNGSDYAALKNPTVQQQAAEGIAEGIADYFAANPARFTKYVKPQPRREYGLPSLTVAPENQVPENPVK